MLKRKFTYKTFDDREVTDIFCFHLSEAEVTKWLITNEDCTLDKKLLKMMEGSRGRDIMDTFEDLIKKSVGIISADGKRFEKSEEITKSFVETQAYSDLFMELCSDGEKAANFIKAIIPNDLSKRIETIMVGNPEGIPDELKDYIPNGVGMMPGA